MATPNTQLSQIGFSDINAELNYPSTTPRKIDDAIVRQLTGQQARLTPRSPIAFSDLSEKAAFDGITIGSVQPASDFGVVVSTGLLSIDSDMLNPDVQWSYQVISGGGNISFTPNGKDVSISLISDAVGSQSVNAQINVAVYFDGHLIGTDTRFVNLSTTVFNPDLQIIGTLSVNNQGFVAQTAVTTITATSNVTGGSIRFLTSPAFGGIISGNTITFSAVAGAPGVDNNNIYTLTTEVLYNNTVVASNTSTVNVRAEFLQPELIVTAPSSVNNQFANSGPINSSIRVSASHAVAGANVVWSATKVSGDDAVLSVAANNAYANLTLSVSSFGAKKSVYDVLATLQYSNGYVLNQKTQRLTLRTVGYGLSFSAAADSSAQGYTAQTAVSTATATFQAGTFTWDFARTSGATAEVSPSIGSNTASITVRNYANTVGLVTSAYRINPVITFDGIVVSNTSSITSLTSERLAYNYSLVGPTSNTIVGEGTLTSSVTTTASHDIPGGYVLWTSNNGLVSLSSNTSVANAYITTTTIANRTTTLRGDLYDSSNRLVQQLSRNIILRAFAPNIRFFGSNNSSVTGYSVPQTATVLIEARADSGANSFIITTEKLSGANLQIVESNSNTTYDQVSFTVVANTVGTVSSTYRTTATVNYFGVTFSKTFDVSTVVSLLDSQFTLTPTNGSSNTFNPPASANGNIVASFDVPGGSITWNQTSSSGSFTVPVANNSLYRIQTSRSTVGTSSSNVNVTATLLDANNLFVKSLSSSVSATATVNNPELQLVGTANSSVSNTFEASAQVTLTATTAAALVGETYQFSTTKVSGDNANISAGASSISLTLTAEGTQSLNSSYDVTVSCIVSGQVVASTTRRVNLSATATAPTISFASSNASSNSFNFPVVATGVVTASSSPASNVQFTVTKLSGSNLTVQTLANQVNLTANQSNVGVISGTYQVTANFYTPGGAFITSRSANVNVRSERFDPGFVLSFENGQVVQQTGWEENITANGTIRASANASLTSYTFDISGVRVSGETGSYSETSNTATVTLTNNRTTDGIGVRETVWDITGSIIRSGQTIAGPFTRRLTVRTVPYYFYISPLAVVDSGFDDGAGGSITAFSNHEEFGTIPTLWTIQKTGQRDAAITFRSVDNGSNNQVSFFIPKPVQAITITADYNVTARLFANGANRISETATVDLAATSSTGPEGGTN